VDQPLLSELAPQMILILVYFGFRHPFVGSLMDDGAMNIVVRDWIES